MLHVLSGVIHSIPFHILNTMKNLLLASACHAYVLEHSFFFYSVKALILVFSQRCDKLQAKEKVKK